MASADEKMDVNSKDKSGEQLGNKRKHHKPDPKGKKVARVGVDARRGTSNKPSTSAGRRRSSSESSSSTSKSKGPSGKAPITMDQLLSFKVALDQKFDRVETRIDNIEDVVCRDGDQSRSNNLLLNGFQSLGINENPKDLAVAVKDFLNENIIQHVNGLQPLTMAAFNGIHRGKVNDNNPRIPVVVISFLRKQDVFNIMQNVKFLKTVNDKLKEEKKPTVQLRRQYSPLKQPKINYLNKIKMYLLNDRKIKPVTINANPTDPTISFGGKTYVIDSLPRHIIEKYPFKK